MVFLPEGFALIALQGRTWWLTSMFCRVVSSLLGTVDFIATIRAAIGRQALRGCACLSRTDAAGFRRSCCWQFRRCRVGAVLQLMDRLAPGR
jgi:hypothetical protein